MRKTLSALAGALAVAGVSSVAAPTTAGAGCCDGGVYGPIPPGALAQPYYGGYYPYYFPSPDYAFSFGNGYIPPYPAYYNYYYVPAPYWGCWRWRNGYRYRVC